MMNEDLEAPMADELDVAAPDEAHATEDAQTQPSKAEIRLRRAEDQRADAVKVRAEIQEATAARDAKTIRLRALRLAKEAADRDAIAAMPAKTAAKKPVRKAKKVSDVLAAADQD